MRVLAHRPHLESLLRSPRLAFVSPSRAAPPWPALASTGIAALDALLGGGIPRGHLTEIVGARSSGRTGVLLALLAHATRHGELAALVDAGDALDPTSAAKAGVELDRLLWVRCGGDFQKALRAADLIARGGGFGLVALDLADLPGEAIARVPLSAWLRLSRAVEGSSTALVLLGSERSAGSFAALAVAIRPRRIRWAGEPSSPGLLRGLEAEAHLVRARWWGRGRVAAACPLHFVR